jgi:hypothetical protein
MRTWRRVVIVVVVLATAALFYRWWQMASARAERRPTGGLAPDESVEPARGELSSHRAT